MKKFPIIYMFLDEYTNNVTAWLGMLIAVTVSILMFSLMNRLPEAYEFYKEQQEAKKGIPEAAEKKPDEVKLQVSIILFL
jgi:hypothetical protein